MKNYGKKICEVCRKVYQSNQSRQRVCSKKCYKVHEKRMANKKEIEFYNKYFENSNAHKKRLKKAIRSTKYRVYDERIINYDSPTGKAFVGIYKEPFQKVVNGFGYFGVLMQTDNRTLVQCHECGKWFIWINSGHLKIHGYTQKEYNEKFGLNKTKSLLSDEQSYIREDKARKRNRMYSKEEKERLAKLIAVARKNREKQRLSQIGKKHSTEYHNRFGTCEKQLKYRLLQYIKTYKDLPSRSKKGEGGRICKAMVRRFGDLNKGFAHYKLPIRLRRGTNVKFIAPNKKIIKFNYNRDYNKSIMIDWMIDNCEVLKKGLQK